VSLTVNPEWIIGNPSPILSAFARLFFTEEIAGSAAN